jgi:hypothetical protein
MTMFSINLKLKRDFHGISQKNYIASWITWGKDLEGKDKKLRQETWNMKLTCFDHNKKVQYMTIDSSGYGHLDKQPQRSSKRKIASTV